MIIPKKLEKGDEIRILAPSCSAKTVDQKFIDLAQNKLLEMGFKVTFSENFYAHDHLNTSDPVLRAQDLMKAFCDPNVKAIIPIRGGFPAVDILDLLDFEIIKKNPKIFCGYSDITVLAAAINSKTGLVTYSGPNFGSFAMQKGLEYTVDYFLKILTQNQNFQIQPSEFWSEDLWKKDQENRKFIKNIGPKIFKEGSAVGEIVGGNMCTLQLLQGTDMYPDLENKIIFFEEDGEFEHMFNWLLDRNLASFLLQKNAHKIKGFVFGRLQTSAKCYEDDLKYIFEKKFKNLDIPVVYNMDFGHSFPIFTFPIGGKCKLVAKANSVQLEMLEF